MSDKEIIEVICDNMINTNEMNIRLSVDVKKWINKIVDDREALKGQVKELKDFITGFHWETHGLYAWASGAITDEQKQMIKK